MPISTPGRWTYSTKRAVRASKTLALQEKPRRSCDRQAEGNADTSIRQARNGTAALDEKGLARARRLVGLKGYASNIDTNLMPAGEVITSYHDLWHVEQSFRMSETDLRARPISARTRDANYAHLTIVFTALSISHAVHNRTRMSLRRVLRASSRYAQPPTRSTA